MKPISPHDPLDDLIAAALHGDLTPEERAQFDSRLQTDPAARAAYQEAQLMHDLLEKTHKEAQPDDTFEQRMVSGVRRKIKDEQRPRETAWESVLVLWRAVNGFFAARKLWQYGSALGLVVVVSLSVLIYMGNQVKSVFTTISSQLSAAQTNGNYAYAVTLPPAQPPSSPSANLSNDARLAHLDKIEARLKDRLSADPNNQGLARSLANIESQKAKYANTPLILNGGTMQGNGTFTGHISGSGGLLRNGAGTLSMGASTMPLSGFNTYSGATTFSGGTLTMSAGTLAVNSGQATSSVPVAAPTMADESSSRALEKKTGDYVADAKEESRAKDLDALKTENPPGNIIVATTPSNAPTSNAALNGRLPAIMSTLQHWRASDNTMASDSSTVAKIVASHRAESAAEKTDGIAPVSSTDSAALVAPAAPAPAATEAPSIDARKLIRNAELDLEVKSYQAAMDQIAALTKAAGGYVDTSNSQKGGNGKLQGTVVVKVLPQNLDDFLLKLRDLGELKNQTIKTDDVTKDYFDTQARLENSRRMEAQLQDLLKHENSKVSDLLQVERELGRVRGDIEQMQGQLKLYDFQVQYATVTMQVAEKDLKQAAAYLLKEQDEFSLFATDVEATFQQARHAADDAKAQILTANLNHNSGSDVSAELEVMVAPDQIEPFLAQIRSLGRVANFTRQTQRVARDGGDSNEPADQTLTEKDKVQVHLSIRSDDETRKQVALTVVTTAVDDALDQAKTAALAQTGAEILSSSLNKTPEGQSTAQLSIRVPGKSYHALLDAFRALGRTASFSLQRDDNSGPGASGDDAPVIVSLALTDDETPLQATDLSILATDVDNQAQQLKKDAAAAGVEIKASSFQRQPDGTELAQMTFRLPMSKYPAFVEDLQKIGKVESLTVQRDDRPDQSRTDETAPAEISLRIHNQGDIVADDHGLWATLRQTFGEGAGALFGSVRVIGVVVAFLIPWVIALGLAAWTGRRIYLWRKK